MDVIGTRNLICRPKIFLKYYLKNLIYTSNSKNTSRKILDSSVSFIISVYSKLCYTNSKIVFPSYVLTIIIMVKLDFSLDVTIIPTFEA